MKSLKVISLILFIMLLAACGKDSGLTNAISDVKDAKEDTDITYDELIESAYKEHEASDNKPSIVPDYGDDKRSVSDIKIWDNEDGLYIKIDMFWQNDDKKTTLFYEYEEDGSLRAIMYDEDKEPIEANEPDYIEEQGEIIKE